MRRVLFLADQQQKVGAKVQRLMIREQQDGRDLAALMDWAFQTGTMNWTTFFDQMSRIYLNDLQPVIHKQDVPRPIGVLAPTMWKTLKRRRCFCSGCRRKPCRLIREGIVVIRALAFRVVFHSPSLRKRGTLLGRGG